MLFLLFPITTLLSISLIVSMTAIQQQTLWLTKLEDHRNLRICANRLASLANFDHASVLARAHRKDLNGATDYSLDLARCEAKTLSLGYGVRQQGSDSRKAKVPNYIQHLYQLEP